TCNSDESQRMAFIYPKLNEDILIPKDLGNHATEVIFKLAHQQEEARVHWYLDRTYVGSTEEFHELILNVQAGTYVLSAMDDFGNRIQQKVTIKPASGS
ncbi:MAG: penicillin-binding protein 1C, partial [Bacteroidota bacterium]